MNKVKLMVLIFLGTVSVVYSLPKFIEDNQVTLTPDQKAEYERKVKERPEVYTFNPMHVGDKWWYNNDGYIHCGKSIISDTLINNIHMYKASAYGGYNNAWMFNNEDSVIVYDGFYNCDNNINTEYLTLEDFSMSQDDQFFLTYWVWSYTNDYWITKQMYVSFVSQNYCNVFGEIVNVKAIMYEEMDLPFQQWTLIWARKYGLIYIIGEFYTSNCIAAQVNGEFYGDSSVVNDDETNIFEESIIKAYPNPFNPSTTISYTLPKEMYADIAVYNLKGQKVKTLVSGEQTKGKHSITWNGTDDTGKRAAAGIYFCKLSSGSQVLTRKLMLMK